MISVNGKTNMGFRLDEVTEDGPVGMEMLMNPFAIVPKKENADRIELAFRLLENLKTTMKKDLYPDEFKCELLEFLPDMEKVLKA